MAKKVIIIRHGDYDGNHNLSEYGKESISRLAMKLLPEIERKTIVCISSMASRGIQSSEILQTKWKKNGISIAFEKKYEVWSGNDAYRERRRLLEQEERDISVQNFDWLKAFIENAIEEIVIVMSHLEFVEDFPEMLGFKGEEIDKGQAMILDLETHERIII